MRIRGTRSWLSRHRLMCSRCLLCLRWQLSIQVYWITHPPPPDTPTPLSRYSTLMWQSLCFKAGLPPHYVWHNYLKFWRTSLPTISFSFCPSCTLTIPASLAGWQGVLESNQHSSHPSSPDLCTFRCIISFDLALSGQHASISGWAASWKCDGETL